jgi:hydrophobe/amphiphile efflux-1 (HAE1) family protein
VISGLVALTLTPALCAIVLRDPHVARGFFGAFNRWFARRTDGYVGAVGFLLRRAGIGALLFVAVLAATFAMFRLVPGSLVPSEDQGYYIAASLLPDGASLARTRAYSAEVEKAVMADPAIDHVATVNGFDFVGGGSNSAVSTMFVITKLWDERKSRDLSLDAAIGRFFGATMGKKEAMSFAFNPPPIQGLGTTGGFEVYVQARGEATTSELAAVAQKFLGELNKDPRLLGVRTLFRADSPQIRVELDRDKAKALGVPVDRVFSTLQAAFGSVYVNDFDRAGRVYRVQIQAEPEFRSKPEDLARLWVRSDRGEMVPLGSLIDLRFEAGAETIERYNLYPSIKLLGAPAIGRSSSEAIDAVEELAEKTLPQGFGIDWTGSAYQEKKSGSASFTVLALGLIFAFLILSAQYERWTLPVAVLLGVPFALLGALLAVWARGLSNDIYFQIGLVTLIGLAAKNAILIVEFAAQRREAGDSVRDAAMNAARLRFRPIVMTSLAFILGVLPLALATGAGAAARRSMGTGVLGGMLFATLVGVLFIPLFFRWVSGKDRESAGEESPATAEEGGDA